MAEALRGVFSITGRSGFIDSVPGAAHGHHSAARLKATLVPLPEDTAAACNLPDICAISMTIAVPSCIERREDAAQRTAQTGIDLAARHARAD
ncbi:hypothetical protein K3217_04930 [bacterium BD-1]|jgi:hypothetical protein|nr:hypothetical protein [Ottowia caeni]